MLGNVALTVIPRGVWVWYLPQNSFGNYDIVTFLRHYGAGWMQTMENAKMHRYCYWPLPSWKYSQSHKQEQIAFKQRGRERQRDCYKTIDLITEYNHFINHVGMQPPGSSVIGEQKKCCHMLGKKFDWFQTGRNNANVMQHSPTWCANERNMLCPTCWHNMLPSSA